MRAVLRGNRPGQGAKGFAHHGAGGGTGREEHLRDSLLLLRGVCEAHMGGGGRCVCEANMGGWKQKCDDGAGKHTPQVQLGRASRAAFSRHVTKGHRGLHSLARGAWLVFLTLAGEMLTTLNMLLTLLAQQWRGRGHARCV